MQAVGMRRACGPVELLREVCLELEGGGLDVGMDGGREKVVDECKYKVEGGKVMMVAFVVVHVVILVVKVVTGLSLLWMMAKE